MITHEMISGEDLEGIHNLPIIDEVQDNPNTVLIVRDGKQFYLSKTENFPEGLLKDLTYSLNRYKLTEPSTFNIRAAISVVNWFKTMNSQIQRMDEEEKQQAEEYIQNKILAQLPPGFVV